MEFSTFGNQFGPNAGILQLMNDLGHAVNSDQDICMLGGGNPAVIPEMQDIFRSEMLKLMDNGNAFEALVSNYDSPQGNQKFISALADMLNKSFGWNISEDNIAITNGSQSSFGIIFNLLSGEFKDGSNRKILLPMCPEYIGYEDVGMGNRNIFHANKPVIQQEDDPLLFKYRVDFSHLNIDSEIGAVCVSRPTNPTGNVVTDNEISKLSELARANDIPLILDGAYGLPFPGITFTSATPVWDDNTILCLSLSKLGLPGTRTGMVVAAEPLIKLLSGSNAIFSLAPGRFGPSLLTRLIQSGELLPLCDDIIRPYYAKRMGEALELVRASMKHIPVKAHKPEGAMFLWLWFEGLPITSEELYQNLKRRGVYVIAGQHFFPGFNEDWKHRHECIRVSYAGEPEKVEQGIKIIAEEAEKAYAKNSPTGGS